MTAGRQTRGSRRPRALFPTPPLKSCLVESVATPKPMNRRDHPNTLVVLPSELGWIAMIGAGEVLRQLTFGHPSAEAAVRGLDIRVLENAAPGTWNEPLQRRLAAYAAGTPVDFRGVRIELGLVTEFRRRVIHHCRQIPFGETITYGELAAAAGSSPAARAVGRCMAANRFPLIVPCHRVVRAGGRLGAYSAPGGTATKRRLLTMESTAARLALASDTDSRHNAAGDTRLEWETFGPSRGAIGGPLQSVVVHGQSNTEDGANSSK